MDKQAAFVAYLEARGHQVTRAGGYFQTTCPFHSDRTPSFYIYPDGHGWCFGGCDEHHKYVRDVIEAIYRLEFPNDRTRANAFRRSLEIGLVQTDTPRPYAVTTLPAPSPAQIEAMSIAFGIYHEFLVRRVGFRARQWLRETRGLQGAYLDLALESVGYSPDGGQYHSEVTMALRAHFGEAWLDHAITTGIISRTGGRQRIRNRLIFVRRDQGRVLYYQARILDGDEQKFLNPPGIRKAFFAPLPREIAIRGGTYIVEGPMDALALAANGCFVLAILGDRPPNATTLNALPHPIIAALDHDGKAGPIAQQTLLETCQANAIPYEIACMPQQCKDPAEWLAQEGSERLLARLAA
jgi:DNA primase